MSQFNSLPTYEVPLTLQKRTSNAWYRFWANTFQGVPPTAETTLTVTTSPFTYKAATKGFVIIQGGTVSLVQFSRGGSANHTTGQTQGCFPLSAGDNLVVTYSVTPNMTYVPQ